MKTLEELKKENRELKKQNTLLQELAFCDKKFGIKNRNFLEHHKNLFNAGDKAIYMIDANGLKTINDTQHHNAGDKYLETIISELQKTFNAIEDWHFIRLGGDEFLIIANISQETAQTLLEEIRDKNKFLSTAASTGCCYKLDGMSLYKALKTADKDMYSRKQNYYKNKKSLTLK